MYVAILFAIHFVMANCQRHMRMVGSLGSANALMQTTLAKKLDTQVYEVLQYKKACSSCESSFLYCAAA